MKTFTAMKPMLRGLLSVLCLLVLCSTAARAQATRTWVSGVGDDTNPGSRTAPCKTYAGDIVITAPGGEIDALDPGDFGPVTVTKSLTIDGTGNFGAIQAKAAGINAIVINAGPNDVIHLRRLSLQGSKQGGAAIRIVSAGNVSIENCYLSGWTTAIDVATTTPCNIAVSNCLINGGTTGVKVSMSGAGSQASLDNVSITNTTNATDLLTGTLNVSNSLLSQNSGNALFAEGGSLNSFNNVLAANGQNVSVTNGSVQTFNNGGPVMLSVSQDTTVQNVAAGKPAVYVLTITPPPGGFPGVVNFSSSGLPSGLTATFNPSSLPAGSGGASVTMTITATPSSALLPGPGEFPSSGPLAVVVLLAGLGLLRTRPRWTTALRPRFATLLPLSVLALLLVTAGCGGGGGGTTNSAGAVVSNNAAVALTSPTSSASVASPSPSATGAASPSPSVAGSPSPSVAISPSPSPSANANPSPSVSPSPTPIVGKFPFTVTITSGSSSVSQSYAVNLQ